MARDSSSICFTLIQAMIKAQRLNGTVSRTGRGWTGGWGVNQFYFRSTNDLNGGGGSGGFTFGSTVTIKRSTWGGEERENSEFRTLLLKDRDCKNFPILTICPC